jgi:ribonuclease Z
MRICVNEASLTSDLTSSPVSIFKDKNITVYSIPVLNHKPLPLEQEDTADPVAGSLKRKRAQSPDYPSKRLQSLMDADAFSADKLEGELAQDWRKLMVNIMFPASVTPPSPPRSKKCSASPKKKGRQMNVDSEGPRIPEYAKNACVSR